MKNKLLIFIIVSVIQFMVPLSLMLKSQKTVNQGNTYHFVCQPLDPNDPFRGKYLSISFKETYVLIDTFENWQVGDIIHAPIQRDNEGFATFGYATKNIPDGDYLDLTIQYVDKAQKRVQVNIPFNKYYVPENLAKAAETIYFELLSKRKVYAELQIDQGNGVLVRLGLEGRDFLEIVKEIQNGDSTTLKTINQ